jgi:site-specific DNA recombinase
VKRAVIYARQSEDVSEGIARQLDRCRSLVQLRDWELVEEFVDNDTSASKSRGAGTQWAAMLDRLRSREAEVVVAVDLDRLLRDTRDLMTIIDTGATVLTVDGQIDLTTADGEFRATMLASIARFEVRRKGERQLRANVARAAAGRPVPTRRRYGYDTDGVTPRPVEAAIVRRMFDHVADGGSLRSLSRELVEDGVDPAPGKEWSTRRLRDLLMNETYAGFARYKGKDGTAFQVVKSEHVVPIVDEELAADVRAILSDPGRRTSPGGQARHLLSGLAHCATCGAALHYMRAYKCPTPGKGHPTINAELIEPLAVDAVVTALLTSGADLFPTTASASLRSLVEQHEANGAKVRLILEDRDAGLVPPAIARTRLVELKTERETIEADLERARSEKTAAGALHELARDLLRGEAHWTMPEFGAMRGRVRERFEELDLEHRREIIRALLYVELEPGRDAAKRVRIEHRLATHLNPDAGDPQHYLD